MEMPVAACLPSDAHLRRRYLALLEGEPVIDEHNEVIDTDYARWRELKRMVIVFGLPRIDANALQTSSSSHAKKKKEKTDAMREQQENEGAGTAEEDKDANVPEARTPKEREAKELLVAEDADMEDAAASGDEDAEEEDEDVQEQHEEENCSLRGRVWKVFLGVHAEIDRGKYAEMAERGASYCDGDIRNDTFRTFRGDPAFAQRVPEEKLVRLLNVFINELGANSNSSGNSESKTASPDHPDYIRYVQGMNVLCAPLLYVMPEADAYYTFCNLIVKHCPHYMAPKLKGVESGCLLVDKCLQTLDPDLFNHLSTRGITARIYALPLILSLFACVPPLHELLRVWDVLFAVGVHFVVVLAVAHTVLLRDQLLQKDMDLMKILSLRFAPLLQSDLLISVALRLLHRLPEELLYEIARHPFENADLASSLPFSAETVEIVMKKLRRRKGRQQQQQASASNGYSNRSSTGSEKNGEKLSHAATTASTHSVAAMAGAPASRPRWKI